MATSADYIEYIAEKIPGCRYRRMFGEYMIYVEDKPVLTVCDNTVFAKMYDELKDILGDAPTGCPYDGAKLCYVVDADNSELLEQILPILIEVTPIPKKRSKK